MMERILVGYHLCIKACGFYSIWNSSSCSIYKEGRYTQWYKMEIVYHSLLTDIIDMNGQKLAAWEDAITGTQEWPPLCALTSLPLWSQPRFISQDMRWSGMISTIWSLRKLQFIPQCHSFWLNFSTQCSGKGYGVLPCHNPIPLNSRRRWQCIVSYCCTKVFMCISSFTQAYFTGLSWE